MRTGQGAALALGYAGLIPFAALALAPLLAGPTDPGFAQRALLLYGAVILSFLGGIVWGRAVAAETPQARAFVISVLPSLLGWIAALAGGKLGLGLCAAGFGAMLAHDLGAGLPAWFRRLRLHLSIGAILSLLLGALLA